MEVFEAAKGAALDHSGGHQRAMFNYISKRYDEILVTQGVDLGNYKSSG